MICGAAQVERTANGYECQAQGLCSIPFHRRALCLPLCSILDSASLSLGRRKTGPIFQSCCQESVRRCMRSGDEVALNDSCHLCLPRCESLRLARLLRGYRHGPAAPWSVHQVPLPSVCVSGTKKEVLSCHLFPSQLCCSLKASVLVALSL